MKEIKENPFNVKPNVLLENIKMHGALVFKNVIDAQSIASFLPQFFKHSSKFTDNPSKFDQPKPISFYRKMNIGSHGDFGEYPRFFRTTYIPFWLNGLGFSEPIFKPIISLRNHIAGLPLDFAYTKDVHHNLWSACRIQQYFLGGSFFSEHKDVVIDRLSRENSVSTIQLVALLSSKGTDFIEGGATIRDVEGRLIDIEADARAGDVIAYDGSSIHGVSPVDPHRELDLKVNTGRVVALASLYNIKR